MTTPTITLLNPTNGSVGVATGTPVTVRVTVAGPDTVDESSLTVTIGTSLALAPTQVAADGQITASTTFRSNGGYTFTPDDVGKFIYVVGAANSSDRTRRRVTAYVDANRVTVDSAFSASEAGLDWKILGFTIGYTGYVKAAGFLPPAVTAGHTGFDILIFPTKKLSQPVGVTANALVGTSTSFLSELNASASIALTGKPLDTVPASVVNIASNLSASLNAYADTAQTPTTFAYRSADLPALYNAGSVVGVFVSGKSVSGDLASSSFSFTTTPRPRLVNVSGPLANPFGLGLRLNFSEAMKAPAATTEPALLQSATFQLVALDGTSTVPTITSIVPGSGNPTYVDLQFSAPLTNNGQYKITITNLAVRSTSNNLLNENADRTVTFLGYGPLEAVTAIKDTLVTTPVISGDVAVPFRAGQTTFQINSLDPDVLTLELGASAVGVSLVPGTFVNNGDGTGTFDVTFSELTTAYRISIQVVDDVDNISQESNILNVGLLASTVPGTELQLRPLDPVHKEVCDRLIADIPVGGFWLKSGFVIPYTREATPFLLNVVETGQPVSIAVLRESHGGERTEPVVKTVIPQNVVETVMLTLGRGRNLIYVTDGTRQEFIIVSATTYATYLCAVASEIHAFSRIELDELLQSIFVPTTTRLAEPYMDFADILPAPAVRSQQLMSTKLAIRSHFVDPGSARAVRDLAAAFTMQTPVTVETKNPNVNFIPAVEPLRNAQEAFGGFDQHIWMHNECISRWIAFVAHVKASPHLYRPVSISETEVLVEERTGVVRRHAFDSSDPLCSTLSALTSCLDNIIVRVNFTGDFILPVCAAMYPFDSCFTSDTPLGQSRPSFDSGIEWDSGIPLDNEAIDPGDDGWVGFCYADRWDSGRSIHDMADGQTTAESRVFSAASHTFTQADENNYVWILSGARQGRYRITSVADGKARLNRKFDINESSLVWKLMYDVRPLDSMGFAPDYELASFEDDGIVVVGNDTFATDGQYEFYEEDVGRNLRVFIGDDVHSLIIRQVISPAIVKVGRAANGVIADFAFTVSASGLSWELWDATPPSCVWDGYANKLVTTTSADVQLSADGVLSVTAAWDDGTDLYNAASIYGFASVSGSADMIRDASCALNAKATVSLNPALAQDGQATLTATATVSASAFEVFLSGSASLVGEATLSERIVDAAAILNPRGGIWPVGTVLFGGSVVAQGKATITASASLVQVASAAFTATSGIQAAGTVS